MNDAQKDVETGKSGQERFVLAQILSRISPNEK